jgi:hypothetical protein
VQGKEAGVQKSRLKNILQASGKKIPLFPPFAKGEERGIFLDRLALSMFPVPDTLFF